MRFLLAALFAVATHASLSARLESELQRATHTSLSTHASLSARSESELQRMWSQLRRHCDAGRCQGMPSHHTNTAHFGSTKEVKAAAVRAAAAPATATSNTTECHSRMVAYEYGLRLQPARAPLRAAFDALKLHTSCGVSPPSSLPASAKAQQQASRARSATAGLSVYVDPIKGNDASGSGSKNAPVKTVARGLELIRSARENTASSASLILFGGVHYLNETVTLGAGDSDLTITANCPTPTTCEEVWVSGGRLLQPTWSKSQHAAFDKSLEPTDKGGHNVYETKVPEDITDMPGLATLNPHRRLIRARYVLGGSERGCM